MARTTARDLQAGGRAAAPTLQTITLLHEELEALRLTDLEERYQADAAEQMGVSRSTLQRIVTEARRKVTQALVEGAALHIEGGTIPRADGALAVR